MCCFGGIISKIFGLLNAYHDAIVSIAALCGIYVAFAGLSVWKKQLKGTSGYQIALKTLRAVYNLFDVIDNTRCSGFFSVEYADREKGDDEESEEQMVLDCKYAYFKRLDRVKEAASDLRLAELEAIALFGKDAQCALEPTMKAFTKLISKAREYYAVELQKAQKLKEAKKRASENQLKEEERAGVLFANFENQSFDKELEKAKERAEVYFRKFL